LTAFMGFKAGMTHVVREIDRPGSKLHKKEAVEAVTVLETPPIVVVGLVGYVETPTGLRTLTTVWASHLSDDLKRRFYKNWYRSKKKAFTKYAKRAAEKPQDIESEFSRILNNCTVVRALCHTQIRKVQLRRKVADLFEVQINGGSIADKIAFGKKLFEQEVPVASVFAEGEIVDICGVTKGKGFNGVVSRWGVTRLPRKTSASTENDLTEKSITPVGGFPHYGVINEDWIMLKGCIAGTKKRVVTLRKSLVPGARRSHHEPLNIKFIDTSSKYGHGRFQTAEEKAKFMGTGKQ